VIQKEVHGSGDEHRGGFGLGNHGSQGKKNNKQREYTKIDLDEQMLGVIGTNPNRNL
jgi:hypothetical protein